MDRSSVGVAFLMRARRIGIDVAIMLTAGSAIPKTLMSTAVAFCRVSLTEPRQRKGDNSNGRLITTIRDIFEGIDAQKRDDASTCSNSLSEDDDKRAGM
jgi:hypothetical protein